MSFPPLHRCTLFLSANQYFGAAIDCIESTGKYKSQMDHFCWMTGTFISLKHFNGESLLDGQAQSYDADSLTLSVPPLY